MRCIVYGLLKRKFTFKFSSNPCCRPDSKRELTWFFLWDVNLEHMRSRRLCNLINAKPSKRMITKLKLTNGDFWIQPISKSMNISTFNWIPHAWKTSKISILRCLDHWMKEHVLPWKASSTKVMNLSQKGGRLGD